MRTWYRNLDWTIVLLWLTLCAVGLTFIYSTTHGNAQEFLLASVQNNFERQFLWLGICAVALLVAVLLIPSTRTHTTDPCALWSIHNPNLGRAADWT